MKKILLSLIAFSTIAMPAMAKWVKCDITDLTATDIVVIADQTSGCAMPSSNGTSKAPQATAITFNSDKSELTGDIADNLKWNVVAGSSANTYTIYPNGVTTTWLYSTNTNNGIRVGTGTDKFFSWTSGYLKNVNLGRYVGVYNKQDWRSYTSIHDNIKKTVTTFYKYVEGESDNNEAATPVITPNSGEISVTDVISISCATEGASIYYTIDGSEPSAENGTLYAAPFTLAEAATVKAIAVAEGLDNSGVAEATFTFPAANINEFITNNYKHASTISGAVTVVAQLNSYLFLQDETAKIIAFGSLNKTYNNGDQLTGVKGTYSLYNGLPEMNVVASSFGTATAGTPVEPTTITLAELKNTPLLTYIKVEGVTVPTGSGKSFTITDASGSATMYNSANAEIVSGENLIVEGFVSCYNTTIQLLPIKITTQSGKEVVAAPVIAPNGGAISVDAEITISCETEGASIYYTIDGTEPSAENGTLYEVPFTLAEDATVKAIAVAEGMENSSVTEAAFTLLSATVSNVTFDFTKPSSLNPVQDEPVLGQNKEVSVNKTVFTAGNVSLSFNKGTAGTDCRIWAGTSAYDLRTYKGSSFTISATGADIINIVFTGGKASKTQMTANVGEFVGSTWTGSAQSVVFTATGTTNINTITVTYDTATAIEEVATDNAPVEYYNLQGVKVANPENGIFIKKQGSKTTKVVL